MERVLPVVCMVYDDGVLCLMYMCVMYVCDVNGA